MSAKRTLGLPNKKRRQRRGSSPTRSPLHAADLAKGHPGAPISRQRHQQSRFDFVGRTSSTWLWDPDTAREFHDETLPQEGAKTAHFLLNVWAALFVR